MNDPEADPGTENDPLDKDHDANGNVMSGDGQHSVPRLCHLRRWEGLSYGFNLISRKGRTGHFIDNIEYGLAAYYSGIKNGDRVVEINGISVTEMAHGDVVKIIKESGKEGVKLLVVDQKTEDYFKEKGYTIRTSSTNYQVQFLASPVERPADVIEAEANTPEVRMRDKPRKKSSIFKRFSTPEPPPPLPMDAILPVETVYATLGSADDLNNSMNKGRVDVRPKLPQVTNLRSEGGRPKSAVSKHNSSTLEHGRTGKAKAKIPNTNSLPGKLRRLSVGKTQPKTRLCHLIRTPGQRESYGFVLRTYHDTMEKMIVRLDENGIAMKTGVKDMDFLIEVDGVNVSKENHQQVTSRIRNAADEISLLVVSPDDMVWFRRNSKVPKSADARVIHTPGRSLKNQTASMNNESPKLRTGNQSAAIRNLNRVDSDERSSTRMDEFQLSEYNSSIVDEERKQMAEKKRKEETERLRREHEESVRRVKQEEEDREKQEQEWERRRLQEEEDERIRLELEKQEREAEAEAERQRQAEANKQQEEKEEQEEKRKDKKMVNGQKEPPTPEPRKTSRSTTLVASETPGKSQEEEQQEHEDVEEVGDAEDKDLEENLNMSVAEIKQRLTEASTKKNKRRQFREKAI